MSESPSRHWLSISDAASYGRVDIDTIRAAIANGELHPCRMQARTWIARNELQHWLRLRSNFASTAPNDRAVRAEQPVAPEVEAGRPKAEPKAGFSLEEWIRQTSDP
jgi:hypothetical protein